MSKEPILILGSGLAGYNLAKEIRKQDAEQAILVITADDGRNYSKPMLSTGFAKQKTADDLAMATAANMADQLNITVRTHTRVTAIQVDEHQVRIDDEVVPYSKLVLAAGADVIKPRIAGDGAVPTYAINDLQDYDAFRQAAEGKRKVLIMGAGLIGAEFANDMAAAGFEIDVVAPCDHLMPSLLPEVPARAVQVGLEELGVRFHFGAVVEQLVVSDTGVTATLSTGQVLETELVVSAIGLTPRTELAQTAGLSTQRGVVTDRYLQTSDSDIYALGDCAEVDGHVLLYVLPLMASARALAKTLTGTPTQVHYGVMPVAVKTPVVPVAVSPAPVDAEGEWQIDADGRNIQAEYRNTSGELLGYALTGAKVMNKVALNKELPPLMTPAG